MNARPCVMDDDRPMVRGWEYGRYRIGSWYGQPPAGAVEMLSGAARGSARRTGPLPRNFGFYVMARLDLRSGEVSMIGPKGKLP